MNNKQFDWAEKYRPTSAEELVLPEPTLTDVQSLIRRNGGQSALFYGKPGCGKTSAAKLINQENNIYLNCGIDRGIEMVKELEGGCTAPTVTGNGRRVVLLDEADSLTHDAQKGLRGVIERCAITTDFIMTANDISKISEALQSRCPPIHFDLSTDQICTRLVKVRLGQIAALEGYSGEQDRIDRMVKTAKSVADHFDLRALIKRLQIILQADLVDA